ncbi:MAG: hypothetical protein ACXWX4_00890 [Actinomycetota bacterium]
MRRGRAMGMKVSVSLVSVVAAMSFGACGGGDAAPAEPGSPAAPATAAEARWRAAVEVAPRADALDAATERLIEPLGPALVVSPTNCFEGLPADAGEGYVIGAVGDSQDEVERLVADAGEPILFSASVTIVCTD